MATLSLPVLSLCIAAKGACDGGVFLAALRADGIAVNGTLDIHVAYDAELAQHAELVAAGWQLHRLAAGTSLLRLWGHAIARSSGTHVAVLNIECPPAQGWLAAVTTQLQAGCRLFSGGVVSGFAASQAGVVGYLVDYAQFHPPLQATVRETPGINLCCDRELLDVPEMLVNRGFYKTFMLWRLHRDLGLTPTRSEAMVVTYARNMHTPALLRQRYLHGRCFAACRVEQPGQPPRLLCLLFTPALPWLKCWRILRAVRRHAELRRAYWRQFHRVFVAECAWSCGEFMGYLFGAGTACRDLG